MNIQNTPSTCQTALIKLEETIKSDKWFIPTNAINKALDEVRATFEKTSQSETLSQADLSILKTKISTLSELSLPPARGDNIRTIFSFIFGKPPEKQTLGAHSTLGIKIYGLADNLVAREESPTAQEKQTSSTTETPVAQRNPGAPLYLSKDSSSPINNPFAADAANTKAAAEAEEKQRVAALKKQQEKVHAKAKAAEEQRVDALKKNQASPTLTPSQSPSNASQTIQTSQPQPSTAAAKKADSPEKTALLAFFTKQGTPEATAIDILKVMEGFSEKQQPLLCKDILHQLGPEMSMEKITKIVDNTANTHTVLYNLKALKDKGDSLKFFSIDKPGPTAHSKLRKNSAHILSQLHSDKIKTIELNDLATELLAYTLKARQWAKESLGHEKD